MADESEAQARRRQELDGLRRDVEAQMRLPRNVGEPRSNSVLGRALHAIMTTTPQPLQWDMRTGVLMGPLRSEFSSWCGFVGRRTIPCTIQS